MELPVREGPGNAKLYRGQDLFNALYESGSYSDTARQLNIARKQQIDLDMQITRKERIPLDVVAEVDNQVCMAIAGILKSNVDKVLTREVINEIFEQFRNIPESLGWETEAVSESRD
jgi:hypothetical protein